jgi:hypothetical protein
MVAGLAERGMLEIVSLLTAFWLGFTARATTAWGLESDDGEKIVAFSGFASMGLLYAMTLFLTAASWLIVGWAVAMMGIGWVMVGWTSRSGGSHRNPDRVRP